MRYVYFVMLIVLSGCSSFTSPARQHELDGKKSYWIDYDATRRGTILSANNSKWHQCAEPTPDAAIAMVAKLEGSIKTPTGPEGSGKGELDQSIIKLAEKTQMVMFLRESLFRLCELSNNSNISQSEISILYKKVIDASIKLVELETATVELEQDKVRLQTANRAEHLYKYLSEQGVDQKIIENLLKGLE